MKPLFRWFALISLFALGLSLARADSGDWGTDYKAALAKAKAENKQVMLDFTGSDWCPWCIRLKEEVFHKPEFKEYAKDKYVLAMIDFPRKKKQSREEKAQNLELQEKFQIEGYPTVVVVDASGKELGRTGYVEGGPEAFIAELDKVMHAAK